MKFALPPLVTASLVATQGNPLNDIPKCAQDCVGQYLSGSNIAGCNLLDYKCVCSNEKFIDDIVCCLEPVCDEKGKFDSIALANKLCKAVSIDFPTAVTCKSSAASSTATSSASSSDSAASGSATSSSNAGKTTSAASSGTSSSSATGTITSTNTFASSTPSLSLSASDSETNSSGSGNGANNSNDNKNSAADSGSSAGAKAAIGIDYYPTSECISGYGRVKEAIDMLEHMVAIWNKTSAETHPSRLASQHELARAYQANGQVKEAIEMLEHVVAIREEALAKNHPDRLASQYALIDLLPNQLSTL
ncbi:hypothetical protein MY10362_009625 [Beauveria mimosiformis]